MIRAILRSNAWQALYLTNDGIFGFFTTPANNNKKNINPPKGKDFSINATGTVRYKRTLKKEY
tara:strand:- start:24 stop:212 length:189 start_codon:yes stop_codon:yes gene_type:complete